MNTTFEAWFYDTDKIKLGAVLENGSWFLVKAGIGQMC